MKPLLLLQWCGEWGTSFWFVTNFFAACLIWFRANVTKHTGEEGGLLLEGSVPLNCYMGLLTLCLFMTIVKSSPVSPSAETNTKTLVKTFPGVCDTMATASFGNYIMFYAPLQGDHQGDPADRPHWDCGTKNGSAALSGTLLVWEAGPLENPSAGVCPAQWKRVKLRWRDLGSFHTS